MGSSWRLSLGGSPNFPRCCCGTEMAGGPLIVGDVTWEGGAGRKGTLRGPTAHFPAGRKSTWARRNHRATLRTKSKTGRSGASTRSAIPAHTVPTSPPPRMSEGWWTPTMTRDAPMANAPSRLRTPHPGSAPNSSVTAIADASAVWSLGKDESWGGDVTSTSGGAPTVVESFGGPGSGSYR